MDKNHSKYHSKNAFCGNAGPEEMNHLRKLIGILSDEELKKLVENLRIYFDSTQNLDREEYENVIDEADREDFHREYDKIISSKN